MMSEYTSLKNHFLIALPSAISDIFERAVVYICEHTHEGAMGIIINSPTNTKFKDFFNDLNIKTHPELGEFDIFLGGPLKKERGFVLHQTTIDKWHSTLKLNDFLSITTSVDILDAIANQAGPTQYLIALGYSAWSSGQLESELLSNVWLTVPACNSIIFDTPHSKRWELAAKRMGVNIDLMSHQSGHA